jgi:hypothetical protein
MFKLELEPWIKADMENEMQKTPILTWGDGKGGVVHLVEDDYQYDSYELIWGVETDNITTIFTPLNHWPKEILRDIVERFPLDE